MSEEDLAPDQIQDATVLSAISTDEISAEIERAENGTDWSDIERRLNAIPTEPSERNVLTSALTCYPRRGRRYAGFPVRPSSYIQFSDARGEASFANDNRITVVNPEGYWIAAGRHEEATDRYPMGPGWNKWCFLVSLRITKRGDRPFHLYLRNRRFGFGCSVDYNRSVYWQVPSDAERAEVYVEFNDDYRDDNSHDVFQMSFHESRQRPFAAFLRNFRDLNQ